MALSNVTTCARHVFLNVLGAVCFSFIKVMQMTRDCRVVSISTNKMMISVMAEFHLAASREFLLTIVFTVTVLLNNQILQNVHNIMHSHLDIA